VQSDVERAQPVKARDIIQVDTTLVANDAGGNTVDTSKVDAAPAEEDLLDNSGSPRNALRSGPAKMREVGPAVNVSIPNKAWHGSDPTKVVSYESQTNAGVCVLATFSRVRLHLTSM